MNEKQELNALSIIDNVSTSSVSNSLSKIQDFQAIVKSQFKQDHDFGIIPGTGTKPTMLKPGAEKLLMLLGLTSEFEIMDSTRDWDRGFFQYQVKCSLKRDGYVITEGLGSANTKEKKYINQDAYTLDNTVLKMAKKRALVDAALLVGSLSDVFTQDIEDMDLSGNRPSEYKRYATDRDGTISTAQSKRLYAIAKGEQSILDALGKKYGFSNTKEIKKLDYEKICAEAENMVNANKADNNNTGVEFELKPEDIPF